MRGPVAPTQREEPFALLRDESVKLARTRPTERAHLETVDRGGVAEALNAPRGARPGVVALAQEPNGACLGGESGTLSGPHVIPQSSAEPGLAGGSRTASRGANGALPGACPAGRGGCCEANSFSFDEASVLGTASLRMGWRKGCSRDDSAHCPQASASAVRGVSTTSRKLKCTFVPDDPRVTPLPDLRPQVRSIETAFEAMSAWGPDHFMVRAWQATDRLLWIVALAHMLMRLALHTVGKLAGAIGLDSVCHLEAWIQLQLWSYVETGGRVLGLGMYG